MDPPSNSDPNLASQLALRVALQTMKERCIALQRRLSALEEENQQMREQSSPATPVGGTNGGAAENFQLRLQVTDLNRQKAQLSEHISMVSNENRKLWSRLSQMAKEQGKTITLNNDITLTNEYNEEAVASPRSCGGANQNLIRSKTFTQHSPNPHLRHKVITTDTPDELEDVSLDEIGLDAYEDDGFGTGETNADDGDADLSFAYLNVDETAAATDSDADFRLEAKKCLEGLQDMRRVALKQKHELQSALTVLETRFALQPCSECVQKSKKPEMADKSLETDDSLSEIRFYNNSQKMFESSTSTLQNGHNFTESSSHLDIIQEKVIADTLDKTCPMCGKTFNTDVSFNAFRAHVELHFIDDSGIENSIDRNFELISHTVGDF